MWATAMGKGSRRSMSLFGRLSIPLEVPLIISVWLVYCRECEGGCTVPYRCCS